MTDAPRTLAYEVTNAFRVVIAGALAMVVVVLASMSWFVFAGDPAIDRSARLVSISANVQADLLEQASMLRAYLVTGDASILSTYRASHEQTLSDITALDTVAGGGRSAALASRVARADTAWQTGWARRATLPQSRAGLTEADGDLSPRLVDSFIRAGNAPLQAVDNAVAASHLNGVEAQKHARNSTVGVVAGTALILLIIAIAAATSSTRRRRRLDERVVGPISVLLAKVRAVGHGEFGPSPVIDAPMELLELRDELANMSASLTLQQQVLATRADDAASNARQLELVVEFAREISDSLTLSNVLAAVTSAGRRLLLSPRVRVWLVDPDDALTLRLRHDSITGDIVAALAHPVGAGGLGRAAREHRVCYSAGLIGDLSQDAAQNMVIAVPMVKGTRVVGVLEVVMRPGVARLDADTVGMLEVTADHAATAIDGALLYELAESLSRSDPLTGLGNRRQLDQDLALEVERSGRYHRPMSLLMLDIDHFKQVNDTFGHGLGDSVLREVGAVLREQMRAGDTAYRFGGEEFVVLARETDLAGAEAIAERLRRVVETKYAAHTVGDVSVTISVGVAMLSADAEDGIDLIGAADAAMYAAKRAGRNQVRVAGVEMPSPRRHVQALLA